MARESNQKKVALFATCLADLWRPAVARSALSLIGKAGFKAEVPKGQTCCGQPNWNSGDRTGAKKLARRHLELLAGYDYIVVPSGSCADMFKNQYPALFRDEPGMQEAVQGLAGKIFELSQFLVQVAKFKPPKAKGEKQKLAWHDSCSCKRGLGVEKEPRALIEAAGGYEIKEMQGPEVCCGFGGLFSVKYGEISSHMAGKKAANIKATGATVLAGCDLGCLLNLEGRLEAEGAEIKVRHLAEILDEGS